jgi:hypothetical protein
MKQQTSFFALLTALLLTSALPAQSWNGIRGEGPQVTRQLDVDDFDGFTLAINARVQITQGSARSVEVEGQENIIDNIVTDVRDGRWKIKFDQNVRRHDGLTIRITMPRLQEASISGSGSIEGQGPFTGLDDLQIGISGSGDIDLDVEAADIRTSISGSGDIRLGGSANRHEVRISGSGDVHAAELNAKDCQVRISGSGDAEVNASDMLEVSTSGSGDVYYRGRPRVKAKVSGSGKVEARGDS